MVQSDENCWQLRGNAHLNYIKVTKAAELAWLWNSTEKTFAGIISDGWDTGDKTRPKDSKGSKGVSSSQVWKWQTTQPPARHYLHASFLLSVCSHLLSNTLNLTFYPICSPSTSLTSNSILCSPNLLLTSTVNVPAFLLDDLRCPLVIWYPFPDWKIIRQAVFC